ncbi:PTS system mannose/fructose/N-acetylgalactosamine-transporter subunit IIB [Helcococcus kunzii]|uniref:PTS EIIB type-4 domain-containing protein n=1 Tax=Helcococcus kunzii ATCC 51366 TaxID=883114 RepID=H3NQH3_9FIRM|nr:PTS sugar transporter subunit IIB [Helcococcus kunzii]EHR32303.1 hypothetical protein HMPREF9709_01584 [Helcococcus kunzii ATCC 51366]
MIKLVRLDERLIHGQVAIKWSRQLGINRIVVVNTEASKDIVIQKSLLMASPPNVKVAIKDIESSIKLLNDSRIDSVDVLVIVSEINDLLRITREVKGIQKINIGNYGRIAEKQSDLQRKSYARNLYLYDSEKAMLKEVVETNVPVFYQTIPDDPSVKLSELLKIGEKND